MELLERARKGMSDSEKSLLSGGIAGSVGKTCTAPLSRITVLLQVSAGRLSPQDSYGMSSLTRTWTAIHKEEGFRAFWKGNLVSIIHRFPYSAINFAMYERFRDMLCKGERRVSETPLVRLACGGAAGVVACGACYPLDLIKTRLIVDKYGHYTGIMHALRKVIQEEGIFGLYRGLSTAIVVVAPTLAINYSVYGTLKEYIIHNKVGNLYSNSTSQLTTVGGLSCGCASGVLSSLLMFPVDLVRRRLQVQGFDHSCTTISKKKISCSTTIASRYASASLEDRSAARTSIYKRHGALAEFSNVLRESGVRGLYRGIVPELLKVTPMVSITFCAFEMCSEILKTESRL